MNITSPITGAAQSGLTSPTYSVTEDRAPYPNGKQWLVSACGGTQPGVSPNSLGKPFTISWFRPAVIKIVTVAIGSAFGLIANPPRNQWKLVVRKAMNINNLGGYAMGNATVTFDIPVGAIDTHEESVEALVSALMGALSQAPSQFVSDIKSGGL